MPKRGDKKGGHTPEVSEHQDNGDDTIKNPAGGQQADGTPGGSQQSVHDPGKKEIEELKQRMVGQEDKIEKMTEDLGKLRKKMEELGGLKTEMADHNKEIEAANQRMEAFQTELKQGLIEEGKTREDVTNEIDRLRKEMKEDFEKLEKRMEDKLKYTYIPLGGFIIILVLAIMLGVVFTICKGPSVSPNPEPDSRCEEQIQALDSRLKKDFENFKGNVDTKISDFRHKELDPLTLELKEKYETLKDDELKMTEFHTDIKRMAEENEEFKKNQTEALDNMETQLEQSTTQLKKNQEVFEENLKTIIQNQQTEERKKLEEKVNMKIDGKSENLKQHVHDEVTVVKDEVHGLNETMRRQIVQTNKQFGEKLNKTELTLSASIKSAREECMEEIRNLTVEIGSVGEFIENVKVTLLEQIGTVDAEVKTLNVAMKDNFASFNTRMDNFQEKLYLLKTSFEETKGMLESVKDDFNHWKEKVEMSEGKIHILHEKGHDTNTMIILVVIIIVFIVVLVVMLMLRQRNTAAPGPINISPGLRGGHEPSAILKQVEKNCVNDNTVCVLHFHKESKYLCMKLTKTVEPNDHKLRPYFLDHHGDILTIPRSKVIIVYVEKNQRNIILEDPDQELGDLRRTTVEAALKMGATVIVIYMHHEESRNLNYNELYCPKLQSVTRHKVLSKLEKQGAVFSVFDSYSNFQQQCLKKLISDST